MPTPLTTAERDMIDTTHLTLHVKGELKAMRGTGMITKSHHDAALALVDEKAPTCTHMSVSDFADYLCSVSR